MFQVFIALIDAWSIGPFHMPLPWMQANSPPERLTPSSRYVAPDEVTRWLPDTCNAGALPGGVVGGVVGGAVGPELSTRHCCWLTPVQDHSCTRAPLAVEPPVTSRHRPDSTPVMAPLESRFHC